MKLSPNEIAYLAKPHWGGVLDDWITSVAVCLAESGGDTEALGHIDSSGNWDHGLWQISNRWHQLTGDGKPGRLLIAGATWRDPYVNAQLAKQVFDERVRMKQPGWSAWAVFNSGAHKTYIPDATLAVKAPWAPPA